MLNPVKVREEIAELIDKDRMKLAEWILDRSRELDGTEGGDVAAYELREIALALKGARGGAPSIDPWGRK